MRSVFAAMIMLSASTAVVLPAEVQNDRPNRPDYGYLQAPVDHRQPTLDDVQPADQARIEMDNELLNQAPANAYKSEDTEVNKTIERENRLLDHELGTICRGC